ncbi:MAG: FMN-binding protein [Erysipelotrichaceae bacterium]|nr:FMN-binding protein [Erysipelotrichaceae bacterium]
MDKKFLKGLLAAGMLVSMSACAKPQDDAQKSADASAPTETNDPATQTPFSAEYEMMGTTSAGLPKNDTFIFEGTVDENGIITTLNFDIIRNKGKEDEYSKKDIMGYLMNVSDAEVSETADGFGLLALTANGYAKFPGKDQGEQYMLTASLDNLTAESTFKDLTVINLGTQAEVDLESAIVAYSYLAKEAGVEELTGDTLLSDILDVFGLYKDGKFVAGKNRVSFAGYNGGRSYGEQIDAIVDHILANKMTLDQVYEMFRTVNQQSTPIEDRDMITGATIAFVGDFQRMVYLAIHGELFEGVTNSTNADGQTKVEVVTQGFGGEIETHVTFDDASGKIVDISVRDANESADYGAKLCAEKSDFLKTLIAAQDQAGEVDVVSGATVTSNALIKAVTYALEFYNAK